MLIFQDRDQDIKVFYIVFAIFLNWIVKNSTSCAAES